MPVSTQVNDLKINQLTKAQYDYAIANNIIGPNEISMITDISLFQVSVLPNPTYDIEGTVYQYIGSTDQYYTNGYFYKCIEDPNNLGTYIWSNIAVQDSASGTFVPQVDTLPASDQTNFGVVLQMVGDDGVHPANWFYQNQHVPAHTSYSTYVQTYGWIADLWVDTSTFESYLSDTTVDSTTTFYFDNQADSWYDQTTGQPVDLNSIGVYCSWGNLDYGDLIYIEYYAYVDYEWVPIQVQVGLPNYNTDQPINIYTTDYNFTLGSNGIIENSINGQSVATISADSFYINTHDVSSENLGQGGIQSNSFYYNIYNEDRINGYANYSYLQDSIYNKQYVREYTEHEAFYVSFNENFGNNYFSIDWNIQILDPQYSQFYPNIYNNMSYNLDDITGSGYHLTPNASLRIACDGLDEAEISVKREYLFGVNGFNWHVSNPSGLKFSEISNIGYSKKLAKFAKPVPIYGDGRSEVVRYLKYKGVVPYESQEEIITFQYQDSPYWAWDPNVTSYSTGDLVWSNLSANDLLNNSRILCHRDLSTVVQTDFNNVSRAFYGYMDIDRKFHPVLTVDFDSGSNSIKVYIREDESQPDVYDSSSYTLTMPGWSYVEQTNYFPMMWTETGGNGIQVVIVPTDGYGEIAFNDPDFLEIDVVAEVNGSRQLFVIANTNLSQNQIDALKRHELNAVMITANNFNYLDLNADTIKVFQSLEEPYGRNYLYDATSTTSCNWGIPYPKFLGNNEITYMSVSPLGTDTTDFRFVQSGGAQSVQVTLEAINWMGNIQSVSIPSVTANSTIIVGPDPSSSADWTAAGIMCSSQTAGALEFTCGTTPSVDVVANIVIL